MKQMASVAAAGVEGEASSAGRSERGRHRSYEISYPATHKSFEFIRTSVLLEMGVRGGGHPCDPVMISSLLGDALEAAGTDLGKFEDLEVVQAATQNGAITLYEPMDENRPFGTVERGKLADLVIAPASTVPDLTVDPWRRRGGGFKTLYGTGHLWRNEETDELETVGGVTYTVKDGIVYDARKLLDDVAGMVEAQKAA